MKMPYPCKGCPSRMVGCHSTCGKYQKAVEENKPVHEVGSYTQACTERCTANIKYCQRNKHG